MKNFKFKLSEANVDTLVSITTGILLVIMIIAHILFND